MRKRVIGVIAAVSVVLAVAGSRSDILDGLWLVRHIDEVWAPYVFFGAGLIAIGLLVDADKRLEEWIRLRTAQRHLGRKELKRECANLADDLHAAALADATSQTNFHLSRARISRDLPEPEAAVEWQRSNEEFMRFYESRNRTFQQQFGGRIQWLHSEVQRRRIDDHGLTDFDYTMLAGVDPIGSVARKFAAISESL